MTIGSVADRTEIGNPTANPIHISEGGKASLLAALLPVNIYEFGTGEAIIGCGRATSEGQIAIPFASVVTICPHHTPNASVLIDGRNTARVILVTQHWALVTLSGAAVPVVVDPTRLMFIADQAGPPASA